MIRYNLYLLPLYLLKPGKIYSSDLPKHTKMAISFKLNNDSNI